MRQSQLSLLKSRKASGSPVSQKRLQRRSLRSLSPERQVSHRAASWTVSCQSPTHGTIDETDAISPTAAARRHHKQRQSFSIPPAAYGAFSQETRGVKGKAARRPSLLTVENSQRSQRQTATNAPSGSWTEAKGIGILKSGYLFAERYEIQRDTIEGKPHCRYAVDSFTGQRVFLKFYTSSSHKLDNALRIHALLQTKTCACKLLNALPNEDGFPACLVYEAGSFTLAERLGGRRPSGHEQQAYVHSILEAVAEMHAQGIVHGNLDPSHVMWFETDFAWKLVSLDAASNVGDRVLLDDITRRRYAAPEIHSALEKGSQGIRLERAADMWAVGLIAFEVFTGTCVRDSRGVKRYVEKRCAEWKRRNDGARGDGVSECVERKTHEQCMNELQTIATLLEEKPAKRATASQALEAKETSVCSIDNDAVAGASENIAEASSGTVRTGVDPLEKWMLGTYVCEHMDVSVAAERIAVNDGESVADFYNRETLYTRRFMDDYLPEYPVHVLTAGEIFRLRISFHSDDKMPFPFEDVISVDAEPPDGEAKPLRTWHQIDGRRLTALALVDPKDFDSQRMKTSCPTFGLVDTKYVQLVVRVKLRLGGGFPDELPLFYRVYLQLKRPPRTRNFLKELVSHTKHFVRP